MAPLTEATRHQLFKISLGLFFGSGLCTLIYETLWVRQLTFSFGIGVYAVSAVLATFMLGLGLGAYTLGRLSGYIRNPLRLYAYFEFAISLYTLGMYFILTYVLPGAYSRVSQIFEGPVGLVRIIPFLFTFILLAVPTALMGGTLPILARYLDGPGRGFWDRGVGYLYGINTLGGVVGTGLAGFWLIKDFGIFKTTAVAVFANLVVAFLALWLSRTTPQVLVNVTTSEDFPKSRKEILGQQARKMVLGTMFASGYTALSYEVIWNRLLLLHTRNSTYAFSAILMMFLVGISSGSLLFTRLPKQAISPRFLGYLQLGLSVYIWLSFYLLDTAPSLLSWLVGPEGVNSWYSALMVITLVTGLIVFVPTVLMGITFPMGTVLATVSASSTSAVTGKTYAALTLGNILGSLVTGFVLIDLIGLRNALAVGVAVNLLCGFLLLNYRRGGYNAFARGFVFAGIVFALFLFDVDTDVFRSFYGKHAELIFYKEEVTDTVMVFQFDNGDRRIFYNDGRAAASISTNVANRMYGHLPMLLQSDPQSVLSICFGVGNTLSALAQHEPGRLVAVELSPGAIEAASYFPSNLNVLETPGLEVVIEDGRNYLLRSKDQFDVISLEPPRLAQATVVNLYTREFYRLAREHLTEDGILVQWFSNITMPLQQEKTVIRTFADVFPNTTLWSGISDSSLLLIGWKGEMRVDPERILARAGYPKVKQDLARINETPWSILSSHLMNPEGIRAYVGDGPLIVDDRTLVDFLIPVSRESGFGEFDINRHRLGSQGRNVAREARKRELFALEKRSMSPEYLFDYSETEGSTNSLVSSALLDAVADARSRTHAKRRRETRREIIERYRQN